MQSCYIEISRQLIMTASIESKEDLMEYISMPYTGNISEMFEDRLGICGIQGDRRKVNIRTYRRVFEGNKSIYFTHKRKLFKLYK